MFFLNHRRLTILLFLAVSLLISNNCKGKKGESQLYRFIDQTQKENVISSPLINLVEEFKKVEQKSVPKDFFL